MAAQIYLHDGLDRLLYRRVAGDNPVVYPLNRRASVKDVLESLGIPHPEIGRLTINGREVSLATLVVDSDRVEVFGLVAPVDVLVDSPLRSALVDIRFVVDINVAKLAALLRMAGFDTHYDPKLDDAELAELSQREQRIALTRDRCLLMRKVVEHGHLIRACRPEEQLAEVVSLYGLADRLQPFSRCLLCNGMLDPVDKSEVMHRLEPLTNKYYDTFCRCQGCDKIYWAGSHRVRMAQILARL